MNGRRAVATIVSCLLATVVVPPLFAWTINQRRVQRAQADVAAIAQALRASDDQLRRLAESVDVLCGPGLLPRASAGTEPWIAGSRAPLSAVLGEGKAPVDPWGNCYAVNLARPDASIGVLSAGPDGIIETPLEGESPSSGNDLVERLR